MALGANLGDRQATFETALRRLEANLGRQLACSRFHETAALVHPDDPARDHPAYLNGVALFATRLAPLQILRTLQEVERELGRDRSREPARWQPRPLDLDLIALDGLTVAERRLRLPHPEMHKRRFVLEPMVEVWPDWRHPELGRTAVELLAALPPEA